MTSTDPGPKPGPNPDTSIGALRRCAAALGAIHGECRGLDADAVTLGWNLYRTHWYAASDHLDLDALAELDSVLPAPVRTGSGDELRLALAALATWVNAHVAHLEAAALQSAFTSQLDEMIAAALAQVDVEQQHTETSSHYGIYI
jgi:hypothetical protein